MESGKQSLFLAGPWRFHLSAEVETCYLEEKGAALGSCAPNTGLKTALGLKGLGQPPSHGTSLGAVTH